MRLWFILFQYVCWFILYIIYLFMFNIFKYKFFLPHMCDAGMQTIYSDRCLYLADQWPVAPPDSPGCFFKSWSSQNQHVFWTVRFLNKNGSFQPSARLSLRRIVSMETMPSKEPMTEDGSTALSDTQTRSTMSTTTLTPRVEPGPGISNLRMRWSFSDTKVVPSVPMQPGISPQNRVSSWAPPGAQAWRSPRHSYTPSACSTPQAPVTPMKPVHEMRPTGTATPPPSFPQFAAQSTSYAPPLAAFPRQPGVRSTVGVASHFPNTAKPSMPFVQNVQTPPVTSPSSRVESQMPTQPTQPGRPPVPPLGGCLDGSLEARQSLGRRMWRSGTHGKAIGPPMHHEKDDNLTSVCVKLQHKLGKLSTKKTISLWRNWSSIDVWNDSCKNNYIERKFRKRRQKSELGGQLSFA